MLLCCHLFALLRVSALVQVCHTQLSSFAQWVSGRFNQSLSDFPNGPLTRVLVQHLMLRVTRRTACVRGRECHTLFSRRQFAYNANSCNHAFLCFRMRNPLIVNCIEIICSAQAESAHSNIRLARVSSGITPVCIASCTN